jgi:dolichol-phosphate mannosyltransferase
VDGTRRAVEELHREDKRVRLIGFTRNFGHEMATTAGLDFADGDAVVIIDADLQDPPEVIGEMLSRWEEGYDVVYGRRVERKGEPLGKRLSSRIFYRLMKRLTEVDIPVDTGDFRLMDREVVRRFRLLRERNRFVRAEIAWLGGNAVEVPYQREPRLGGKTKYSTLKRLRLALDGITSFSAAPLRFMSFLGFFMFLVSLAAILVVFVQKVFFGLEVPGYAFLVISLFLLNGTEIFFIGVLGEYLGRMYREVQERPLYLVSTMLGFEGEGDGESPVRGDV